MKLRPAAVLALLFATSLLISAAHPPLSAALIRDPSASAGSAPASLASYASPAYVQVDLTRAAPATRTRFTRGTVSRGAELDRAINLVLESYSAAIPALPWYAVTDITPAGSAYLVSVVGLAMDKPATGWSIEQAGWFGLLLLARAPDGGWLGALQDTPAFTNLLDSLPESALDAGTRAGLDPRRRSDRSEEYIFPWEPGTLMEYVSGVHQNGFSIAVTGWLAVDFISYYDPQDGMAPPVVRAAASGVIDWKCSPYWGQSSAAVRIGELMYVHLLNMPDLETGRNVSQGELLGYLVPGPFEENCGVAKQGEWQYHLHLGFPATSTLSLEGWTLNLRDHKFYKGEEVRGVKELFVAGAEQYALPAGLGTEVAGAAGGGAQPDETVLPLDLQLWLAGRAGVVHLGGGWGRG
ncbi:MAG: hypothetical protein ACYC6L_00375 [Anaerolineae bacterium]